MFSLVVITAGVAVASVLGSLPVWAAVIPGALLLGFLLMALIAASSQRTARATARRRSDRSRQRARATRGRASVRAIPAYDDAVDSLDVDEDADLVADDTWEPVPTTLPTYLAGSTAEQEHGVGGWSSREMLEQAEVARSRQSDRRVARAAELAALHRAAEEFFEPAPDVMEPRDRRSRRRAVGD
jgi:hypothetical protein